MGHACSYLGGRLHGPQRPARRSLAASVLFAFALVVPGLDGHAQTLPQPEPPAQGTSPPAPPGPQVDRPGYRGGERNPFALTPVILERGQQQKGQAVTGFQPAEAVQVPNLKLRGVVIGRDGRKAALLEVQGMGTFVVREGDRIGLKPASANAAIRIARITRTQVEVEAGSLRQLILVR